jgi:hypothetical protein
MFPLILIPCTNRKRQPVEKGLEARTLPKGSPEAVAKIWFQRIDAASKNTPADSLYGGRAFREAANAANLLNANFCVVSAGLGLVSAKELVPSYSLTVAPTTEDSIAGRLEVDAWHPSLWWQALKAHTKINTNLSALLDINNDALVLIALSKHYAKMIGADLAALDDRLVQRLRLFGLGIEPHLAERLHANIMPYDQRFDGPDSPSQGTRTDFATRALHHFSHALKEGTVEGRDRAGDGAIIEALLVGWRKPSIPVRERQTDEEIVTFIDQNWQVVGGRSARMLRFLRDSGLACEQGRFQGLFRHVAERRSSQQETLL